VKIWVENTGSSNTVPFVDFVLVPVSSSTERICAFVYVNFTYLFYLLYRGCVTYCRGFSRFLCNVQDF